MMLISSAIKSLKLNHTKTTKTHFYFNHVIVLTCSIKTQNNSNYLHRKIKYGEERIYPALQVVKKLRGNFALPLNFQVPTESPWPSLSFGIPLGKIVSKLKNRQKKWNSKSLSLEDLGFEFHNLIESRWKCIIKPSLLKYKEIYGNFDVPSTFAIPESELWPEYSYYLKLGEICSRINKHQSWVSKHEELQKIGYIVPTHPKRVKKKDTWDKKIFPALVTYRKLYDHFVIPYNFIVPQDSNWPILTHGMKLGEIVWGIRKRNYYKKFHNELLEIGFDLDFDYDKYKSNVILTAMKIYKEIHGHFRIPYAFIVPNEAPWPKMSRGYKLGRIAVNIKQCDCWRDIHFELEQLGFEFGPATEARWEFEILPGIEFYKQKYGNYDIPANFVISEQSSEWPTMTRGLELGKIFKSICTKGEWKNKHKKLIEMGVIISIVDK